MEVNFKFGQGPNQAVRVWRYSRWEENAKCIEEQNTWGENNHVYIILEKVPCLLHVLQYINSVSLFTCLHVL